MSAPAPGAPASTRPFGPADRVSFLAEQRRRRRQTWRLSALCVAAVLITGLPLSVVLTPAAYAALLGALRISGVLTALGPAAREALRRQAMLVPRLFDALGGSAHVPFSQAFAGGLAVVAPGVVVSLVLWLAIRALFVRAGAGGALLALGAREPRQANLEERQLVDLAEEMATAGGVPAPRVLILDTAAANAGALGSSPRDASVVVTRGLLESLERPEKEAVVGHLIGSIGNGDLRIAVTITSMFHSMAFVLTVLEAFVGLSGSAWKEMVGTLRWALSRRRDAAAAEAVSEMLSREIDRTREDGLAAVLDDSGKGKSQSRLARAVRRFPPLKFVLAPLYLPYVAVLFLRMEILMLRGFVAGPLVMLVWRARRYLADAMAVQLTRDPDSLARALEKLSEMDTAVPRGQWAAHLFVVGSGSGRHALAAGDDQADADLGGFVGTHPSLRRRLTRLAAMGSALAAGDLPAARRLGRGGLEVLLVLGPLGLLMAMLLLAALGMVFALAGGASLLFAGVAMALIARFLL